MFDDERGGLAERDLADVVQVRKAAREHEFERRHDEESDPLGAIDEARTTLGYAKDGPQTYGAVTALYLTSPQVHHGPREEDRWRGPRRIPTEKKRDAIAAWNAHRQQTRARVLGAKWFIGLPAGPKTRLARQLLAPVSERFLAKRSASHP